MAKEKGQSMEIGEVQEKGEVWEIRERGEVWEKEGMAMFYQ